MKSHYLFLVVAVLLLGACSSMRQDLSVAQSQAVLDFCVAKMQQVSGEPLSPRIDHAFVSRNPLKLQDGEGIWVTFAHGHNGILRPPSEDAGMVFNCGVERGRELRLIYLGFVMGETLVEKSEAAKLLNSHASGGTIALFKRVNGRFKYVRSGKFTGKYFQVK